MIFPRRGSGHRVRAVSSSRRDSRGVGRAASALLALLCARGASSWIGCTAEEECLASPATPRCLPAAEGAGFACTLDYAFNESGWCACGSQECVALAGAPAHPERRQLLVIGE